MEIIMESLLVLVLLAGFVGSIAFVFFIGARPSRKITPGGETSNVAALPYSRRPDFFSAAERSFYEILQRLTPDHTVFAKVRLADLVHVKGTASRQAHLSRVGGEHIDFVVCDKNLVPVVAVELNDAQHAWADGSARDEFIEQVLAAAALPVVYVQAQRAYVLDEIHRLLSPYLRIGTMTLQFRLATVAAAFTPIAK